MIQSCIKKEALEYMDRDPVDYFKNPDTGAMLKAVGDISYRTFCRGLDGEPIRHLSAVKILLILGVPKDRRRSLIMKTRTNEPDLPETPKEPENVSRGGVVHILRTH